MNLRLKLCTGLTSPKVINNLAPALNEVFDDFVDLIRVKRDKDGVIRNFDELLNFLGLEAMAVLLLDRRLGLLEPEPSEKCLRLAYAIDQSFVGMRDSYYGIGLWKYLPDKTWKNFIHHEETVYE